MIYRILIGSKLPVPGTVITVLVEEETFDAEGSDSSDYFSSDIMDIKDYGTVDISGPAEHMVPAVMKGE